MTLNNASRSKVFCDWLDITAPPGEEHRLRRDLGAVLVNCGADRITDDLYALGGGKVKLHVAYGVFRASFSGAAIRIIEALGLWEHTLAEIGGGPHRVTRLDAAIDLSLDGADAISELTNRYPRGYVRLGRREIKVKTILETRDTDGLLTGTWYAGHKSAAEITARVYDKALEMLARHGQEIPPTTRVELTVRRGATLRDAAQPERIFWHYVSPALLTRPDNIAAWDSGWAEGWHMAKVELLPAQVLKRRVERSAELSALIELADTLGPHGRTMLMQLLSARVRPEDGQGLGSRTNSAEA